MKRGKNGERKIEVVNVWNRSFRKRHKAAVYGTRPRETIQPPTVSLSFAQIHTPLAGLLLQEHTVSTRVACFNGKCVCPDASTTSVHRSIHPLPFHPSPRPILVQPADLFSRHEHSGTIVEEGRVSGRGDESNWHRAASFLHLLQPIPIPLWISSPSSVLRFVPWPRHSLSLRVLF